MAAKVVEAHKIRYKRRRRRNIANTHENGNCANRVLCTANIKPDPRKYGYIPSTSFDDGGETGWCVEGGEEAYYEALKRYESMEANGLCEQDMINDITLPQEL